MVISEIKNTLGKINNRLNIAEEKTSELEEIAINYLKWNRKKRGWKIKGTEYQWSVG